MRDELDGCRAVVEQPLVPLHAPGKGRLLTIWSRGTGGEKPG